MEETKWEMVPLDHPELNPREVAALVARLLGDKKRVTVTLNGEPVCYEIVDGTLRVSVPVDSSNTLFLQARVALSH